MYRLEIPRYRGLRGETLKFIEWYKTNEAEVVRPYRDRIMKSINRLRFKSAIWTPVMKSGLWNLKDGEYVGWNRIYRFVNDVRLLAGMPKMERDYFEEGRRCRNIFTPTYEYSLEEFWLLCWGDW